MSKTTQLMLFLSLMVNSSLCSAQTQKELDSLKRVAEMEEIARIARLHADNFKKECEEQMREAKKYAKRWRKDKKRVGDSLMMGKDGTLFLCGSPSVHLSRSIIESGLIKKSINRIL